MYLKSWRSRAKRASYLEKTLGMYKNLPMPTRERVKRPCSRVKNLSSVTTLWLTCFYNWFHFFEPFIKYLAPIPLAKILAFSSSGPNLRWPPAPSWKINFWTGAPRFMWEYTFLHKLTMGNSILTSVCRFYTILSPKSKMAATVIMKNELLNQGT